MHTSIHVEGGKNTPLIARVLTILDKHLAAAIAGGREDTARLIATEISKVGGVNRTTIQNCSFSGK